MAFFYYGPKRTYTPQQNRPNAPKDVRKIAKFLTRPKPPQAATHSNKDTKHHRI